MKYEIKHRVTGELLYSHDGESLKESVVKAARERAYLRGAYLRGADLHGAYLQGADLQGAYLQGAYLQGADLQGAYLQGADLRGAYLQGAYLQGADLQGADLQGAYLQGAYLRGVKCINRYRVTPLLMLLDQPGPIRAYKLVNTDGYGPFNGGLKYEIGGECSVDDANTDELEPCGAGINVATLDWCMKEWQTGYRILVAEFAAVDIACIPVATDGKFRLYRCRIVGEKNLVEIGLVEAATVQAVPA